MPRKCFRSDDRQNNSQSHHHGRTQLLRIRKVIQASCDWEKKPGKNAKAGVGNKTRLYRYKGNFRWNGIARERYKPSGDDWAGIIRQTLIGNHGESAKFHLRYFEIAPYGYSSFEVHRHEHVVIGIRGQGICIAGKKRLRIGYLDTLYIRPGKPHQLKNPFNEPFGFFCLVNAKRDRPKILKQKRSSRSY
jgi:quercetin dioxygenase-like cupin family protein